MVILFLMSADLYIYLTIGLGFKNYPKLTPHMLKSIHWVLSYGSSYIDLTIGFSI